MNVDFDIKILDLAEKPLKDGEKDMTLGSVVSTAMITVVADDQTLASEEKVKMFHLAQIAIRGGMQDLKIEDVAFLKRRIGKLFGALVVGRVFDALEGTEKKDA